MWRFVLLLLVTGCASDPKIEACKADTVQVFEHVRQQAMHIAPSSYLQSVTLRFRGGLYRTDWGGKVMRLNGLAVYPTADVYLDADDLCSRSDEYRHYVVAHEMGHMLSYVSQPDFKRATYEAREDWADNYAKVLGE